MTFEERLRTVTTNYEQLITQKNEPVLPGNGIFERYQYPVLTAEHAPVFWRYDLSPDSNPYFMERFGINGTFNAGAMKWNSKYIMVVRVEGNDRKSFFAVLKATLLTLFVSLTLNQS